MQRHIWAGFMWMVRLEIGIFPAMAYDELLEQRIRRFFTGKGTKHEAKRMMGGLCFMVNGKMCVGVEKNRLMARIGPEARLLILPQIRLDWVHARSVPV